MSTKTRVMLAIPDLQDLGVQHDVRCLMKFWDRDRYEPLMLVHRREGAFAEQFPSDTPTMEVDAFIPDVPRARVLLRLAGYVRALRKFRPHAVISFVPITNLSLAYARPLSGVPFGLAVSEHAHVTASMRDPEAFQGAFLWYYRRRFTDVYNRRADLVKCIAEESRQDLIGHHGIAASKTRLIHNPVDMEEVTRLASDPVDHPWFDAEERRRVPVLINVGRLQHQKRQDLLLEAFARVRARRPARLALVGRGSHRSALEAQAARLGIASDVLFVGFQRNPWRYMAKSSLLVMSSEWEGLPCVLTEAMTLGLPIVSTSCPSGPTEMLLGGRAGRLVPVGDVDALTRSIEDALDAPDETRRLAEVASANLDRFRPEPVTRQYEALADELASIARRGER